MAPFHSSGSWRAVLSVCCALCMPLPVVAQEPPAPAAKINPTGRTLELQSPLQIGKATVGTLLLSIDPDDRISLQAEGLLALLGDRIAPATLGKLRDAAVDGVLALNGIEEAGIDARFDLATLSLVLRIPRELLVQRTISLAPTDTERSDLMRPATLSGYVNLDTRVSSIRSADRDADTYAGMDVDGQLRLAGPVLQFEGRVDDIGGDDARWRRDGTRLVQTLSGITSQLVIGDVFSLGRSFQSPVNLLGVRLGREYEVSPGRIIRPLGQQQFSLAEAASVSVLVDGAVVRRLSLDAGEYDIRDIPLANGGNTVELLIENADGSTESIVFSQLFDSTLLAVGELDYALNAGVIADTVDDGLRYFEEEPVFSGFLRYGWKPWLTGGVNLQARTETSQAGLQAVSATPLGPVGVDVAASTSKARGQGWAAEVNYQSLELSPSSKARLSAGIEFQSERFDDVDDGMIDEVSASFEAGLSRVALRSYLTYSTLVTPWLSAAAGLTLAREDDGDTGDQSAYVSLGGRVPSAAAINWTMRLLQRDSTDEADETSVFVGLSYRPASNDVVYAAADSGDESLEVGYRRNVDSTLVGGYSAEVSATLETDEERDGKVLFGYTANRFEVQADHTVSRSVDEGQDDTLQQSNLRLGTAIAFAGSQVAIGRPIADSFAIVRAHETLDARTLRLDSSGARDTARTGWLGPALVPSLGRYNTRSINYSVDDLPLGYDLGSGLFAMQPPLGAGYPLTVGSAATATVIGVLIDSRNGEPFALATGKVYSEEDEAREPIVFFTNRNGKFAVSGIAPGRYALVLDGSEERRVSIDVSDDSGLLVKFDTIEIE